MLLFDDLAEQYRDFAAYAAGDSMTLESWALEVAEDPQVLAWIGELPPIKQQPNLVFAAARFHGVDGAYDVLRAALLTDDGTIRRTIQERATQTNEAGRLATLVPAFAQIDEPLALLEVGASAGLCLYPDLWGYEWQTDTDVVTLGHEPRLTCRVKGPAPLPRALPDVAWRGGIDLNPLDVTSPDDMRWLETLVWPEQDDRRASLRHATDIARAEPPNVVAGDLLTDLPSLVEQASSFGTVVVFHSAVIAYLEPDDRLMFDAIIRGLVADGRCHWISNEGKSVLPSVTRTGPPIPPEKPTFVLGIDGHAVAHTHGHGRSMRWL